MSDGQPSSQERAASRSDALARGERRYFSGKPCPAGHIGPRDTLLAECCECRALWRKAQKQRDRAKLRRYAP